MEKRTTSFLNKPLYIYLYGIAFLVFKATAYLPSFRWQPMLACLVIYFLASYSLLVLFRNLTLPAYAGLPVLICWVSLLHVVGIAQVFGFSYAYIPYSFYTCFYLAC